MLPLIYTFHFLMRFLAPRPKCPPLTAGQKLKFRPVPKAAKFSGLKGKGFPSINSHEKGDQLIHVNVWTPQHVSGDEKETLEQMQQSENFKPKPDKNDKTFWEKIRETFS